MLTQGIATSRQQRMPLHVASLWCALSYRELGQSFASSKNDGFERGRSGPPT